jgi:hypothetical protein
MPQRMEAGAVLNEALAELSLPPMDARELAVKGTGTAHHAA